MGAGVKLWVAALCEVMTRQAFSSPQHQSGFGNAREWKRTRVLGWGATEHSNALNEISPSSTEFGSKWIA